MCDSDMLVVKFFHSLVVDFLSSNGDLINPKIGFSEVCYLHVKTMQRCDIHNWAVILLIN